MGFSAQCPFWSICTEFLSVLAKYTPSATCEVNHYMKSANFQVDVSKNSFLIFCMFLEVP